MTAIDYHFPTNNASVVPRHLFRVSPTVLSRDEAPIVRAVVDEPEFLSASPWQATIMQGLLETTALRLNWDSYGGLPTSMASISTAFGFLSQVMDGDTPLPSIVPLSDGGVQLEWHRGEVDIEVTFPVTDAPEVYLYDTVTGNEIETTPWSDRQLIRQFIARL